MNQLPQLRTSYGEGIGIELFFRFPNIQNNEVTYMELDKAAGVTTIDANGTHFSVGQYIVIGRPGSEKTEIVRIHASTAPTATTITLAAATRFSHSRGDIITHIPYNQIVVERSTDSGANYTALTAIDIRPDATETYLQRSTDAASNMYKFRFFNSADSTYSAYSDAVTATGYASNSVYMAKRRALIQLGKEVNEVITDEFLNETLWEGRREVDSHPKVLRWPFRIRTTRVVGTITPGTYSIDVPTDLRSPSSAMHILDLRIGRARSKVKYQGANAFAQHFKNIGHATLNGAVLDDAATIVLSASGEFDDSGVAYIAAESVSDDVDAIEYTGNTLATNTLTGVSGVDAHATGRDVWQGATFGTPTYFTVDAENGKILFDKPFTNDLGGEYIYMTYYSTMPSYNSDADLLDEPEYDMFVSFLKWKIKARLSNGKLEEADKGKDEDHKIWDARVEAFIQKQFLGQGIQLKPGA